MLPHNSLSIALVLLSCPVYFVASLPTDNGTPSSKSSLSMTSPLLSSSNLLSTLDTPSANDWEHFSYPIPNTRQILKGRIFTSRPIRPSSLHFMIDGGIAETGQQLSKLGNTRLRLRDNPYRYQVPGCHFEIGSKTSPGGRPLMTYGMMRDVFLALEQVLEKAQRSFETSFVLTDQDQMSWGHGQVVQNAPATTLSRLYS